MRKIMFFTLLFYGVAYSQNPLLYTNVVKVDSSISKNELFSRARVFFSESFVSSKAVLDTQDKEAGELIGNGSFHYMAKYSGGCNISFAIKILIKDGRYKYEFSDFYHKRDMTDYTISYGLLTTDENCPYKIKCLMCGENLNNKAWRGIIEETDRVMSLMVQQLKSTMEKPITGSNEW